MHTGADGVRTQVRSSQQTPVDVMVHPALHIWVPAKEQLVARVRVVGASPPGVKGGPPYRGTAIAFFTAFVSARHPAPWQEEPPLVSPATTMSQRFTVSKSDGDRRPSDIQGEVNQLFEGDEPTTSAGAEGEDAAATEVEVVLKGKRATHAGFFHPTLLFVSYGL